jgi:phage terminase small subunit
MTAKKPNDQAPTPAPEPPEHLSDQMKEFWRGAVERKPLQAHELLILAAACESHDRAEQARQILLNKGLTYEDRFKQPRSRPEIAIERDNRAQFAKLLGKINLHVFERFG